MDTQPRICAVIPAFNEVETVSRIVRQTARFVRKVIVVDDHSTDGTGNVARRAGAEVIKNLLDRGAQRATLYGIQKSAGCDIIVTLDADGQHPAEQIPSLVEPIVIGTADFVLARRRRLPPSEKPPRQAVSTIIHPRHQLDVGTGFRAFRRNIFTEMRGEQLGLCGCGSFVLYAYRKGARISEVGFDVLPRAAGSSKFANVRKYSLHEQQAAFLLREYGKHLAGTRG